MKNREVIAKIQRFSMIGARHWHVTFHNLSFGFIENDADIYEWKKFNEYKDARAYALTRAYARNIRVYE